MTQAVIGDKILTQRGVEQRNFDAATDNKTPSAKQSDPKVKADSADVLLGHQRLLQQAGTFPATTIESLSQARTNLARLQTDIATDPATVLRVAANVDRNTFEAAIATPTG